jgi:regulator of protease activity HflC (stomatin/prohibitin superfamily)
MNTRLLKSVIKSKKEDPHIPPIAGTLFGVFLVIAVIGAIIGDGKYSDAVLGTWVLGWTMIGSYLMFALKVAAQWEKVIVLRLGKFTGLRGPGLFWIIPIVDSATTWIDHRVMVTPFAAQKTLTKDTVPVDVDAVLFWVVWDAEKAALEVEDYRAAVDWAAQTALRDIIGKKMLADILIGRSAIDKELQAVIDERTTP